MIGYSKHELGTINMLYFRPSPPKTGAILPPPPPHSGHFLLSPKVAMVEWFNCTIYFLRFYKEIFGIFL